MRWRARGALKPGSRRTAASPLPERPPKRNRQAQDRIGFAEALTTRLAGKSRGLAAILALTNWNCHWPIGDPLKADFRYCLEAKGITAGPYCAAHTKMAKGVKAAR